MQVMFIAHSHHHNAFGRLLARKVIIRLSGIDHADRFADRPTLWSRILFHYRLELWSCKLSRPLIYALIMQIVSHAGICFCYINSIGRWLVLWSCISFCPLAFALMIQNVLPTGFCGWKKCIPYHHCGRAYLFVSFVFIVDARSW